MSWELILQNDAGPAEPLLQRIDALFVEQRASWPALRDGEAALARLETKTLLSDGARIVVQTNPARRRSTHAKIDSQSLAARPCFLCPANMPTEERGVAFEDFVVLPNPFPILRRHCTIAGREHRPQVLAGRIDALLRLARAVGPELAAFYNGPRCGASAPDHFHFQAARAADIPILAQLPPVAADRQCLAYESFGRNMLVLAGPEAAQVCAELEQALERLRQFDTSDEEPMINLVVHFGASGYRAVLFPRRAHRPRCYFADGPERISVSPAALEMAGVLVVTQPEELARLDSAVARSIYQQVSMDRGRFEQMAASLT